MAPANALPSIAQTITEQLDGEIYFEVGPLLEENWTGIPVAAAGLARELLTALPDRLRFFLGCEELAPQCVTDALDRETGTFLHHQFHQGQATIGPIHRSSPSKTTIGIYPSTKSSRRLFDVECNIIHDVSTLITPHFHSLENVLHHAEFLQDDIDSNDVTICVSQATATDLQAYLGVPADRLIATHNGVSWNAQHIARAEDEINFGIVEPYFLILGTREPRKNLALVIELLDAFPELMNAHRFIFTGRLGWLQENQAIPSGLMSAISSGRIHFTGFISESDKCKLLMAADATIYPSFFEGFGLPVIESLSVGTPCIASCSSSIPEIGGPFCRYFDPYSVLDLYRSIEEFKTKRLGQNREFRADCRRSVASFTWSKMAFDILTALEPPIRRLACPGQP